MKRNKISDFPEHMQKQLKAQITVPAGSANKALVEKLRGKALLAKEIGFKTIDQKVDILVYSYRTGNFADNDNLTAKGVIDSIVDAKILEDDKPEFVRKVEFMDQVRVKSRAEEKMIIEIWSIDDE